MIIYHLKELMHQKAVKMDTKLTYADVVEATGVSRSVLARMASRKGYHVSTEAIVSLCTYFNCTPNDLITIRSAPPATPAEKNIKPLNMSDLQRLRWKIRIPSPALIQTAENIWFSIFTLSAIFIHAVFMPVFPSNLSSLQIPFGCYLKNVFRLFYTGFRGIWRGISEILSLKSGYLYAIFS